MKYVGIKKNAVDVWLLDGCWDLERSAPPYAKQQAKIMLRDELLALVEDQLPCHPAWANSETSKPPQVRPTVG